MIDAGVDLFVALVSSTAEIITVICDRLPEIVDGIAAGLTSEENLAKMGEAGITLMKAVARVFTKNPIADLITADVPDWYINGQPPPVTPDSPGAKRLLGTSAETTGGMIDPALAGYRASGGPVTAGLPYMTGETGPELFVPSTSGYVMSNSQTTGMLESIVNAVNMAVGGAMTGVEGAINGMAALMGASGTYNINVVLPDGQTLASVIFDPLRGIIRQKGVAMA